MILGYATYVCWQSMLLQQYDCQATTTANLHVVIPTSACHLKHFGLAQRQRAGDVTLTLDPDDDLRLQTYSGESPGQFCDTSQLQALIRDRLSRYV